MLFKTKSLTPEALHIVRDKGTEQPFTGNYDRFTQPGTYLCRQCGLALFRSQTKFHSGCGWPSFDEEIKDAVHPQPDQDGIRTEIMCVRCHAHLGHVFSGEHLTLKNKRYCVNSLSLDFVADLTVLDTEEAIFAGGCFWGVEYLFAKCPGVLNTEVGYTGGDEAHPNYKTVCHGRTGHFEAVRILFDPKKIDYTLLTKFFFEIHDPTQKNGQGPDLGEQYLSVIFYSDDIQKKIAEGLIAQLEKMEYKIATRILPAQVFWPAEVLHQNYYLKNGKTPYCHFYKKRF